MVSQFPRNSIIEEKHHYNKTIISFAYEKDLNQIYDFYCARYKDIEFEEFMNLGITNVRRKLESIPESEPLYTIIKSRTIDTGKIKDKEERKYWENLKRINKIPDIYISNEELDKEIIERVGKYGNNFKRF